MIDTQVPRMPNGRTILVSENRLLRDGIRQMLAGSPITIVGEGGGIQESLAAMGTEVQPDLVLFHVASAQHDEAPLAAVRELHEHFDHAKLVILADQCARPVLSELLQANVSAILFTWISSEMLERSLQLVLSDHRLFPADIMPLVPGDAAAQVAPGAASPEGAPAAPDWIAATEQAEPPALEDSPLLSPRENQVVQCVAIGLSNKTIARRLHITEGTVKVHVKGLLRKLRAANRTQLAVWALRHTQPRGAVAGDAFHTDSGRAA